MKRREIYEGILGIVEAENPPVFKRVYDIYANAAATGSEPRIVFPCRTCTVAECNLPSHRTQTIETFEIFGLAVENERRLQRHTQTP